MADGEDDPRSEALRRIRKAREEGSTNLNLERLGLTVVPSEVFELTALTVLHLDENQLTDLPVEIGQLSALITLYIDENRLSALPAEIGHLTTLDFLSLSNNQLSTLPAEIGQLIALKDLFLHSNHLSSLPAEIGNLVALEDLYVAGNPLPGAILAAEREGTPTLLALLRSLTDPANVTQLCEAKLMITGEGKVGKTCLRKALCGTLDLAEDSDHATTWGVECGTMTVPHPDEADADIHLNYWDFGGQKIYRVTHQFFYSDHGIYLLTWNPRIGDDQSLLRGWLTRIEARTGGNARVILVATHSEAEGGNYDPMIDLARMDPEHAKMIVEQVAVDSLSGHNIDYLKQRIAHHTKGLPGIDSPINRDWDAARRTALDAADTAPWMTYEAFEKICADHGITDGEAVRSIAATYLHRLGRGVWYGNDWPNEALLRNTIVRDPAWLAQAFMEVIEHRATRDAGGILDHAKLEDVWVNHGREADNWRVYPVEEHERLMRMLRAQGVALPTKDSHGQRSLVPQLVPKTMPALPWANADRLPKDARILRMVTQLKPDVEGIMPRLIAALEPYHLYVDGCGLFWEDGIFLRDDGRFSNEALITLRREKSRAYLNVTVTGEEPGFLLNQIDTTITDVIQFWKGMERDDDVLCQTRETNGEFCGGSFKLKNVERWLEAKKDTATCQDCDAEIPVRDLVYGIYRRGRHDDPDEQIRWMAGLKERPAPSSIVILPAESRWKDIASWQALGRSRIKVRLHSEFSGALVAEKEITNDPGILRYLGPVAKLSAVFFGAAGLPFALPEGFEDNFGEMADTLDRLGDYPDADATDEPDLRSDGRINLHRVDAFLKAIGLDPKMQGMDLVKASNGKYYWMSANEVEQHRPQQAVIPRH